MKGVLILLVSLVAYTQTYANTNTKTTYRVSKKTPGYINFQGEDLFNFFFEESEVIAFTDIHSDLGTYQWHLDSIPSRKSVGVTTHFAEANPDEIQRFKTASDDYQKCLEEKIKDSECEKYLENEYRPPYFYTSEDKSAASFSIISTYSMMKKLGIDYVSSDDRTTPSIHDQLITGQLTKPKLGAQSHSDIAKKISNRLIRTQEQKLTTMKWGMLHFFPVIDPVASKKTNNDLDELIRKEDINLVTVLVLSDEHIIQNTLNDYAYGVFTQMPDYIIINPKGFGYELTFKGRELVNFLQKNRIKKTQLPENYSSLLRHAPYHDIEKIFPQLDSFLNLVCKKLGMLHIEILDFKNQSFDDLPYQYFLEQYTQLILHDGHINKMEFRKLRDIFNEIFSHPEIKIQWKNQKGIHILYDLDGDKGSIIIPTAPNWDYFIFS